MKNVFGAKLLRESWMGPISMSLVKASFKGNPAKINSIKGLAELLFSKSQFTIIQFS